MEAPSNSPSRRRCSRVPDGLSRLRLADYDGLCGDDRQLAYCLRQQGGAADAGAAVRDVDVEIVSLVPRRVITRRNGQAVNFG